MPLIPGTPAGPGGPGGPSFLWVKEDVNFILELSTVCYFVPRHHENIKTETRQQKDTIYNVT